MTMPNKKRIMFLFGTRPEAIKMAPLISEVSSHGEFFVPIIAVTGQHREMLDQALSPFGIRPDFDLSIMEPDQTLSGIVTKTIKGVEELLLSERPDMIMVQGDTTTAFAAALTAFYRKVPVGHIEAGLRTFDKFNPFPEEMNRKLITHIADLHFAPTRTAMSHLIKEGIERERILLTGNTVIDALIRTASLQFDLKSIGIDLDPAKKLILVTTHRRESFGAPMRNTCEAIEKIAQKHKDNVEIVLPVHRNPNVSEVINDMLGDIPNVILTEPLDYVPFVHLMKASYLILTDSGGVQEEAPSLGKPVLVLRKVTERPEAVTANTVKIVGTDPHLIVSETERLITDEAYYKSMANSVNPYGDGKASERITKALLRHFGFTDTAVEEFKDTL